VGRCKGEGFRGWRGSKYVYEDSIMKANKCLKNAGEKWGRVRKI
jgi:hypothetical protein